MRKPSVACTGARNDDADEDDDDDDGDDDDDDNDNDDDDDDVDDDKDSAASRDCAVWRPSRRGRRRVAAAGLAGLKCKRRAAAGPHTYDCHEIPAAVLWG